MPQLAPRLSGTPLYAHISFFYKVHCFLVIGAIQIIPSALSDLKDNTIHSVFSTVDDMSVAKTVVVKQTS